MQVDFSECCSEEVTSFFWRSVYFQFHNPAESHPFTHLAVGAVVGGLVLGPAVPVDLDVQVPQVLLGHLDVLERAQQAVLDELEVPGLRDADVAGDVPRQVDHGHDGLVLLQLVPLVALDGRLVLVRHQGAHVPGDVIAPTLHVAREKQKVVKGHFMEGIAHIEMVSKKTDLYWMLNHSIWKDSTNLKGGGGVLRFVPCLTY